MELDGISLNNVKKSNDKKRSSRKKFIRIIMEALDDATSSDSSSSSDESDYVIEKKFRPNEDLPGPSQPGPSQPGPSTHSEMTSFIGIPLQLPNKEFPKVEPKIEPTSTKVPMVHPDVAEVLTEFIQQGLDANLRKDAIQRFPVFQNCPALIPPVINPEILAASTNVVKLKDYYLVALQQQLAAGLTALATSFDEQYHNASSIGPEHNRSLLENMSASLQIFAGVFHAVSRHRRAFIIPTLQPMFKEFLKTRPIDEFLFGKDLKTELFESQLFMQNVVPIKKPPKKGNKAPWPQQPLNPYLRNPSSQNRYNEDPRGTRPPQSPKKPYFRSSTSQNRHNEDPRDRRRSHSRSTHYWYVPQLLYKFNYR